VFWQAQVEGRRASLLHRSLPVSAGPNQKNNLCNFEPDELPIAIDACHATITRKSQLTLSNNAQLGIVVCRRAIAMRTPLQSSDDVLKSGGWCPPRSIREAVSDAPGGGRWQAMPRTATAKHSTQRKGGTRVHQSGRYKVKRLRAEESIEAHRKWAASTWQAKLRNHFPTADFRLQQRHGSRPSIDDCESAIWQRCGCSPLLFGLCPKFDPMPNAWLSGKQRPATWLGEGWNGQTQPIGAGKTTTRGGCSGRDRFSGIACGDSGAVDGQWQQAGRWGGRGG